MQNNPISDLQKQLNKIMNQNPTTIKTLFIPEDEITNVLPLMDALNDHKSLTNQYNLWKKVEDLLPETIDGDWNISLKGTKIIVRQEDEEA